MKPFAAALFLALWCSTDAAIAVGPHSMKMHLEWNSCVEEDRWDDWQLAFERADVDGDGHVSRHDLKRLYKEHFDIMYDLMHDNHRVGCTCLQPPRIL